jgi:hypothetical protein
MARHPPILLVEAGWTGLEERRALRRLRIV